MGYLISMHLTKSLPDIGAIRASLPPSIGATVFRHATLELFAIDTFRATKPNRYPFVSATPATDISLVLPVDLVSLTEQYERLRETGAADGLKRSYINLANQMSSAIGQDILTIYANDDESDFACLVQGGKTVKVVAGCGEEIVVWENGMTSVLAHPETRRLHGNASEMFASFSGYDPLAIGLGTWDPPMDLGFIPAGT